MKRKTRQNKRIIKRFVSFITASVMSLACFPVSEMIDSGKKMRSFINTLTVSAETAAHDPYTDIDYSYTVESGNEGSIIKITNIEDLVWYSHAYYNFAIGEDGYADHQNDTIVIAFGENNNYLIPSLRENMGENFEPIGTEDYPFMGKVLVDGSSTSTFYMEAPLFGVVCDNVKIAERSDENTPKRITIATATPAVYDCVFARKVKDDGDNETSAVWQLNYGWYTDNLGKVYTSMIGEIGSGAEVSFDVTNNAVRDSARSNVINTGEGDVGIICGKLDDSAKLTATYSGTNTGFSVVADDGNAGGFVGYMGDSSEFELNIDDNPMGTNRILSRTGYAGGIVGMNEGGTVTVVLNGSLTEYPIEQNIIGYSGAGSIFGYYKPCAGNVSFDASVFSIDSTLTVTDTAAYAGGMFGKVENDGSILTITGDSDTVVSSCLIDVQEDVSGTAAAVYGGLIGEYYAANNTDSLEFNTIKSSVSDSMESHTPVYGGGIGYVSGTAYVKFDTFTLDSAVNADKATVFGGLVAETANGYIYADDIAIGTSEIADFNGGGLIGKLGDGVLGMTGNINVANSRPTVNGSNGQIVGTRDNALIYAENWTYAPNSDLLDNVGSWGDVIVFGTTTVGNAAVTSPLTKANVMTDDNSTPTTHVLTVPSVNAAAISDTNVYTRASIQYQIDPSKNLFVSFGSQLSDSTNFTLTGDITLTNSGVRGITRDKGSSRVTYKGNVSGAYTVTLDIKNVGGAPVYYHNYLGMFGTANGSSFTNTKFSGTISVSAQADDIYVGTAAGHATSSFTATDCQTLSGLTVTVNGPKKVYAGRLLGYAEQNSNNNSAISGGAFDGTITGSNSAAETCYGGVIGRINYSDNSTAAWDFSNAVTLKGTVSKSGAATQKIGGLVAEVNGNGKGKLALTSVNTDGLTVSGNASEAMGGLLGYGWYKTDVDVTNFDINDTSSVYTTVSKTGNGSTAGVVHTATGHWNIIKLDLSDITVSAGSASAVGMIVNHGYTGSGSTKAGIYMEIPETSADAYYKLSFRSVSLKSGGVFDEICAYSADSAANIMNNHQGIISIATAGGLVMSGSASDSLSYKNQTEQGAVKNPNTRYYYNLDAVEKDKNISSSPQKQLMSWGLYHYACSNISGKYFTNSNLNQNLNYDMEGYSWYPVTLDTAASISGTFKFYNKEFDACERDKAARSGITNKNIWPPLEGDQHYMMQNGLFYNVTENLTIGNITLQGNIGCVNGNGTGALVYGTAYGHADSTATHIVTISSTSGSISLDGIKVWNLSSYPSYAPLLINQASEYVTMNINEVSTTGAYTGGGTTIDAATSLIGKAGNSNTSQYIKVVFTNIKLDGRASENNSVYDTSRYNTTKSIFTGASLLEQLRYTTGGSGTYNYYYDDDWGTGTPHRVTYGKEVGYRTEGQHPDQERMYAGELADGTNRFTRPDTSTGDPYALFAAFLPYVKTVNSKAEIESSDATENYYQLQVNFQAAAKFDGCGTYNDPYQLKNAADVAKLSRWIRGGFSTGEEVNIPAGGTGSTWCTDKITPSHISYKYDGSSNFTATGQSNISAVNIQKYLAGAYYIFPNGTADITLDSTSASDFQGLGTKDAGTRFRGVIIGNGITITNKTVYPFINYSDGSVVKDLTITVDSNLTLLDATESYSFPVENGAYGAVISQVMGGDNIIDHVQVTFGNSKITTKGNKAQFQPVGGYIGVVVNGGVIFKNMSGNISGLTSENVTTTNGADDSNQSPSSSRATMADDDNLAWLYVNPIIGRVINGYAVTEATAYHPREADCTMKNGTKHYSITDIKDYTALSSDDKLSVTNNKAISIPDSQSFFIMSLIVNAGMGIQKNKGDATDIGTKTGYFDSSQYQTVRRAEYSHVGTATSTSDSDYDLAHKDTYSISTIKDYIPYLVTNYTNTYTESGTAYYFAKQIANTNNNCIITLTGSSYDLPDGYKGIGSFYTANHSMKVINFDGNGATIRQNTSYNYYFTQKYNNVDELESFDNTYKNINNVGLGLFNTQAGVTNNVDSSRYYNFILTGAVKGECINNRTGQHIRYIASNSAGTDPYGGSSIDMQTMLSVGALMGVSNAHQYINSVALQNIDVRGIRYTGGMIGFIPGSNTTIRNTLKIASNGIKVHGAGNTGGMIARSFSGSVDINNGNATYSIEEVVCECIKRTSTGKDYQYGVGGFIGNCRGSQSSVKIEDVVVGTDTQTSLTEVKCENAQINAGGMIGILNNVIFTLSNCKIYNQSVSSKYTSGGLVGYVATLKNNSSDSMSTISGVIVECSDGLNGEIRSDNNFAGGFIGACKYDASNIKVTDSEVNGYTISGSNYVGGIVGLWSHNPSDGNDSAKKHTKLITNNVIVEECIISGTSSSSYVGGIVGYLSTNILNCNYNRDFYGYNILTKNLNITGTNKGSICGGTASGTYNVIKLVAFSQQEELEEGETSNLLTDTVGSGDYGSGGYVIFADYLGDQTNKTASAVTPGTLAADPTQADGPFININPKLVIDSTKYLTGDAVSGFYSADKNSTKAFAKICKDIRENAKGNYTVAASYADTEAKYNRFTNKISSFAKEMQNYKPANGVDIPVLIVDDSDPANTTALINEYISLLTNTSGYNFADNKTNVYDTYLSKCVYDSAGSVVTYSTPSKDPDSSSAASSACLKRSTTSIYNPANFYMLANKTDTLEANASHRGQFTLLDVRFFDPSEPTKVAYHLYVPVYVRKLLEYDFDIRVGSGTNYYKNPVSRLNENNVIENMGVPVTLEFAYTYKRTISEWITAANNGDDLLANYDKSLIFANDTRGKTVTSETVNSVTTYSPSPDLIDKKEDISMVLIDPQNNSKAYYLDQLNAAVFRSDEEGKSTLNLNSSFDGFAPLRFNDLMEITVSSTASGTKTLVAVSDLSEATLIDKDGNGYRYRRENETATHTVTDITFKDGSSELTEHYFLTIYTKHDQEDAESADPVVYHYTIGCPQTFGSTPFPSRLTTEGERKASHLLLGYIYNNSVDIKSIKVGGSTEEHQLTDTNNQMMTEIEAKVGFTQAGLDNVKTYLNQRNHPEIFESILIKYDKRDGSASDIGVKGVADVAINSYTIGSQSVLANSNSTTNASHIELRNNTDLADYMFRLGDIEDRVTIRATATVTFDNIAAQFYPESPVSRRTYVLAYSNIASNREQTAYSKISAKDLTDPNAYYTSVTEAATLTYDAVDVAGEGITPQLGINPIDEEHNSEKIQTLGAYDIEHFLGSAESAGYIRCDIELKSISDSYTAPFVIADYIDKESFSILNDIPTAVPAIKGDSDTTWTFIFDKDDLELKGNIYQIPIEFTPYTGEDLESGNTRKYANYGLFLKVSMLVNSNDNDPIAKSDPAADYVKYTNARIYTEKVDPTKGTN